MGTLPQLERLDGKDITKSERITAAQHLKELRRQIMEQQKEHSMKREQEKEEFRKKQRSKETNNPGFDGRWYTDPQAHIRRESERVEEEEAYTPENRLKTYMDMAKKKSEQTTEPV